MNLKVYSTKNGLYHGFLRSLFDEGIILSHININNSESNHLHPDRKPEVVVDYNASFGSCWTSESSDEYNQFYSIELKDYFLDISAYAIGHPNVNYPVDWDFSVSTNGEDWITLHQPRSNHDLKDTNGKIFHVKRSFVRYFKWTNKGPNNNGANQDFYITKVDLYGSAVKCTQEENCKNVPHIEIPTICYKAKQPNFIYMIFILY